MIAVVDVQVFKTDNNKFILKELAIGYNDQLQVYLIQPPCPVYNLSTTERKQVNWIERNRKVNWNDGYIPYSNHQTIVMEHLEDKIIYCKGLEKVSWIKEIIGHDNVFNLEDLSCPNLLNLYEEYRLSPEVFSCIYHPTICSLKNVTCLRKWCLDNKVFKSYHIFFHFFETLSIFNYK